MSEIRLIAALLLAAGIASAQSPGSKNCSVDGTVVNSATGAPIIRAHVTVAGSGDSVVTDSDSNGKWSASNIGCGTLTITASRQNFLVDKPGQLQTVLVAVDTPLHDVIVRLAPQAVITGRVLDNVGDPVQNALVTLMSAQVVDGIRRFTGKGSASANDIGEYRIAGIVAGKYVVCAGGRIIGPRSNSSRAADPRAFGEQCTPGAPSAGAAGAMDVRAGSERIIDFQLTPLPLVHVRGFISGGPEGASRQITLSGLSGAFNAALFADGAFEVTDVTPGSYFLTATAFEGDTRFFAAVPVEAGNADVAGLHAHLEAGLNVSGIVRIVSTSGIKNANPQYSATLMSSNMFFGPTRTVWNEDNTAFTLTNVLPGSYRLRFGVPAPFYVKSATLGGLDILGSEVAIGSGSGSLEVTLSDDCGFLQGDVSTDDGPAPAAILLVRDAAQHWNARADAKGHFKIEGLPPGDYKAYAWDDLTNVEYGNPDWMQLHANGVSVTVEPGQTAQVKLTRQTAPEE